MSSDPQMLLRNFAPLFYYATRRPPRCHSFTSPAIPPADEPLLLPRSIAPSRALLLLHIPRLPTTWPPRLELASLLLSHAAEALKVESVALNAVYDPTVPGAEEAFREHEEYPARLHFPDGRVYSFPEFSRTTLDSVEFEAGLGYSPGVGGLGEPSAGRDAGHGRHEILVCTHGARDCRCADRGGPLVTALRKEIERQGIGERVMVGEVAHVGGHK